MIREYSTPEAWQMLGVSRRTLFNWIAAGTARPSRTAPGKQGQHSWTQANLEQIARRHGRTITPLEGDDQ